MTVFPIIAEISHKTENVIYKFHKQGEKMKKTLLVLLAMVIALSTVSAQAKKNSTPKEAKAKKVKVSAKKDVLKDDEYKALKTQFFNADGYGNTYNCKVEKQRFCRVKDLDTGIYVLCDRDVSRTQWESAKIFYKYGRCTKMN